MTCYLQHLAPKNSAVVCPECGDLVAADSTTIEWIRKFNLRKNKTSNALGGLIKPTNIMEHNEEQREILNAISTLTTAITPLHQAEENEVLKVVANKICKLVGKLD